MKIAGNVPLNFTYALKNAAIYCFCPRSEKEAPRKHLRAALVYEFGFSKVSIYLDKSSRSNYTSKISALFITFNILLKTLEHEKDF